MTQEAANCITIDGGKGQAFQDATAPGEIVKFESNELNDYSLGDATKAYKGSLTKCLRHIVHIKPGIFVLFDELEAPKPVSFEWWLHALSEIKFDNDNKVLNISQGDARLKVRFLQSEKVKFQPDQRIPRCTS